jgi:hypothetical protein
MLGNVLPVFAVAHARQSLPVQPSFSGKLADGFPRSKMLSVACDEFLCHLGIMVCRAQRILLVSALNISVSTILCHRSKPQMGWINAPWIVTGMHHDLLLSSRSYGNSMVQFIRKAMCKHRILAACHSEPSVASPVSRSQPVPAFICRALDKFVAKSNFDWCGLVSSHSAIMALNIVFGKG